MKLYSLTTQSIFSFVSQFLVELKHEENTSQFDTTEPIDDHRSRSYQAEVNQSIRRVQENYFLERRGFL
ncbi:MAG: hypothetical protein LH702_37140 [Phormidesmis sp. CAN_BIN44]|nr:hypothetical protein [Phormidesmis sp. CAN_BIN44]